MEVSDAENILLAERVLDRLPSTVAGAGHPDDPNLFPATRHRLLVGRKT